MTLTETDFHEYLDTTVTRPGRRSQGDTVFGICTINPETEACSNKLYDDRDRAETRLQEMASGDFPLYNPEIHAVAFYEATVSSSGPSNMRDTFVVDPSEEELVTLTNINLLETWQVDEHVDFGP